MPFCVLTVQPHTEVKGNVRGGVGVWGVPGVEFSRTKFRGTVEIWEDVGKTAMLPRLLGWQSWLLQREPHGLGRSGVCNGVRMRPGEHEQREVALLSHTPHSSCKSDTSGSGFICSSTSYLLVYKAKMIFLSAKAEHGRPVI